MLPLLVCFVGNGDNLLLDHEARDAHHGDVTAGERDGMLGELALFVKVFP